MGMHTYDLTPGRINEIKGEILAHAVTQEVLPLGFSPKKMPKKQGDNITYRRWLPYGATAANANSMNRPSVSAVAHLLQEGVTPAAETMTPMDLNVQIQQYGCLYAYTDKMAELYEDDVPSEMKTQTGERMGLVREMIRYGEAKACSNVYYAGGTSRATVVEKIGVNLLRKIARNLLANHAKMKNRILSASPDFDTSAIEAGFLVICHSDVEPDIRDLPYFVPVAKYGQRQTIHENEIGSCERFRFVISPELAAYPDSGAAVSGLGLYSTTGTNADVYPVLVFGMDAAFDIALRGEDSFDMTYIPHTQKDKSDPHGQRGYVGATFWSCALVVNAGWMAVAEVAVSSL